jgi:hypothetical protein
LAELREQEQIGGTGFSLWWGCGDEQAGETVAEGLFEAPEERVVVVKRAFGG